MEFATPPPPKPWYRARNIVLAVSLVLAILIGRETWIAMTARPGGLIDYPAKLRALVESYQPAPPGAPDAWPILLQAIQVEYDARSAVAPGYPRSRFDIDYTTIGGPPPHQKPDESGRIMYNGDGTWADVEARARVGLEILRSRGVFDLLARIAECPRATRPVIPDHMGRMLGMLLPELSHIRQFARIQKGRMVVAAENGDWSDFASAYEESLALARVAAQQGLYIDALVGMAVQNLAASTLREMLTAHPPTPKDVAALRRMLTAADRQPFPPVELALKAERIALDDMIQWSHSDNGRGSGRLIYSELTTYGAMLATGPNTPAGGFLARLGGSRFANFAGIFFASKRETIRKADEHHTMMLALAPMTVPERQASGMDPDAFMEKLSPRFLMLRIAVPATGSFLRSHDMRQVMASGARLMLAIEIHRLEHAALPESLDALVPSLLPALPEDPVSGQPFVYRRLDTRDRYGRDYLLYSLGADGEDDGARRLRGKAPQQSLFPGNPGSDFIINDPPHVPDEDEGP